MVATKERLDLKIPAQNVTFSPFPWPSPLTSPPLSNDMPFWCLGNDLGVWRHSMQFTFCSQARCPWRLVYASSHTPGFCQGCQPTHPFSHLYSLHSSAPSLNFYDRMLAKHRSWRWQVWHSAPPPSSGTLVLNRKEKWEGGEREKQRECKIIQC